MARDGTAELDVLLEPLTEAEVAALGKKVLPPTRFHIAPRFLKIFRRQHRHRNQMKVYFHSCRVFNGLSNQLLAAAVHGRSDEIVELIDTGANIECKSPVRHTRFYLYLSPHGFCVNLGASFFDWVSVGTIFLTWRGSALRLSLAQHMFQLWFCN